MRYTRLCQRIFTQSHSIILIQALKTMSSNDYTWVKYNPLQSLFTDLKWFFFGSPIEQLCKHLPLYKAEVVEKPREYK